MPRRSSISIVGVAFIATLASAPATPEPVATAAVTVEAVGHADALRPDARRAAIEDALRHAVEAGAGVHVASESVVDHTQLIRDAITVTSAGRVRSYRVTQEGPDGGSRYAVRLQADVVPDPDGPAATPGPDTHHPAPVLHVVVEGQPQTAAYAAQRLRERGLNAHAATDGEAPPAHEPTLVLLQTQRCVAAPDAYGLSLVRADVSVTATLTTTHPDGLQPGTGKPSGRQAGTTTTRQAYGATATAAASRAHQRALDAALRSLFEKNDPKNVAPARNP